MFVPFEIAKKLKEKGFITTKPFAMYQPGDIDKIYPLYTSDPYYYDFDDFDGDAFIAPTISQVINWLYDKKKIFLTVDIEPKGFFFVVNSDILTNDNGKKEFDIHNSISTYPSPKEAYCAGIEYVLEKMI